MYTCTVHVACNSLIVCVVLIAGVAPSDVSAAPARMELGEVVQPPDHERSSLGELSQILSRLNSGFEM